MGRVRNTRVTRRVGARSSRGWGRKLGSQAWPSAVRASGSQGFQQQCRRSTLRKGKPGIPPALGWRGSSFTLGWLGTGTVSSIIFLTQILPLRKYYGDCRQLTLVPQTTCFSLSPCTVPATLLGWFAGGREGWYYLQAFFSLLICVHCFPDALWGEGEEIFISPISVRITRILKYHLEVQ